MTSSRDVSRGSIAARNERGADRGVESGQWSPRETLLLRGASAADAVPYQRSPDGPPVWGRRWGRRTADAAPPAPPDATAVPAPVAPPRKAPPVHLPPAAAAAGSVVDSG